MSHDANARSALATGILRYLKAHPQAQDTVEGIEQWWLRGREPSPSAEEIQSALLELMSEGEVEERTGPNGRKSYRLKQEKPFPR